MKKFGVLAVSAIAAALIMAGCGGDEAKSTASSGAQQAPAQEKVETTVFKLAFNQPEDHPEYRSIAQFSDKLKEATGGRYEIEIFPNELLGSQKETIEMVQNGSLSF